MITRITTALVALCATQLTTAQTTWTGAGSNNFWSNPSNWSAGVPGSGTNAIVGIDYSGPRLDVDAQAGSLTIKGEASVLGASGFDLSVAGTTTIEKAADGPNAFGGGELRVGEGSVLSLGTLANFSNGALTGNYVLDDQDYTTSRAPTVIQFRGANVIENRANVYLFGPDSAMLNQDTGQNAFRNLAINNGNFSIDEIPALSIAGNLTNNGYFFVYDYSADFHAARIGTKFTVNGMLVNGPEGYFENDGGAETIVTGDFNNSGGGRRFGVWLYGDSVTAGIESIIRVKGNLRNAPGGAVRVYGSPQPARLIVEGNMTNAGTIVVTERGSVQVSGSITVNGGGEFIVDGGAPGGGGFETFQMTAARLDVAAGSMFGARGTAFCDLTNHGVFRPGASPGTFTVQGDLTFGGPSRLEIEIGGAPGGALDHVIQQSGSNDTGTRLGGTLAVSLVDGFTPTPTQTFTILTSDRPLSGAFDNAPSGGRVNTADGAASFRIDYSGTNTVTLTDFGPATSPVISDFSPSGVPNFPITINGSGFFGTTAVNFNGAAASSFSVDSDVQITAVVPIGATDGPIEVVTNHGEATSGSSFDVLEDDDGDGMSNIFEAQYPIAADPSADSDGDGASNFAEYRAGTNPASGSSAFRITNIRREGSDIVLRFPSVANKRYHIEATADVREAFTPVITNLPPVDNPNREVRHVGGANQPARFYRAAVLP